MFYAHQLYFLTLCIIYLASTFISLWNCSYIGQQARRSWEHILCAGNAKKNLAEIFYIFKRGVKTIRIRNTIQDHFLFHRQDWQNHTLQYVSISYIQWPLHTVFLFVFCTSGYIVENSLILYYFKEIQEETELTCSIS